MKSQVYDKMQQDIVSSPTERALDQAARKWADGFAEKDAARVVRYFSADVIAMYPIDTPTITGTEANYEHWVQSFQVFETHPITVDSVTVAGSKDVGYTFGRWAVSGGPGPGTAAGRYIATWKWTNEGWKITVLSAHIHEDIPPADILTR